VWPFLLGVYGWSSTSAERAKRREEMDEVYEDLREDWKTHLRESGSALSLQNEPKNGPTGDEAESADILSKLRERKFRIGNSV
jgi:hypothetical protein